jgi:RNA polymerase sigma-70 factor (ECF subfamily)
VAAPDLDEALVAARVGDEWAIACLFRAFQPPLLRYLRHHAPEVAEDLASETWLAAAKGLARFEGDVGDFRAWLFSVAWRRVADHYRRRGRQPKQVLLDDAGEPAAPVDVGDAAVGQLSAQAAIDALVRDLPHDQAEVVLLRVLADLSVDEVAKVMGRSPGSVRVLQHRALRQLGRLWDRTAVTQ